MFGRILCLAPSVLFVAIAAGCGDDPDATDAGDSGSTSDATGTDSDGSASSAASVDGSGSTDDGSTSSAPTDTGGSETSPPACEPDFAPYPADALPRCTSETLDCWIACPAGDERNACLTACWQADTTPPVTLEDGTSLDCGRCINGMFGSCWHDACPEQVEASRCCARDSGCDADCLDDGPCDEEDIACLQEACGAEFEAEAGCLQESGALASCRIEAGGLPSQCFVTEG